MSYLLDTSICIPLLVGSDGPIQLRLEMEMRQADIFVSSIVFFEVWYGVYKSKRVEQNRLRTARLLSMGVQLLPFDAKDAEAAGRIRASLQASNQPIGPYDTLIAGQALARGLTLVTANKREFSRVDGLLWEDWSTDAV